MFIYLVMFGSPMREIGIVVENNLRIIDYRHYLVSVESDIESQYFPSSHFNDDPFLGIMDSFYPGEPEKTVRGNVCDFLTHHYEKYELWINNYPMYESLGCERKVDHVVWPEIWPSIDDNMIVMDRHCYLHSQFLNGRFYKPPTCALQCAALLGKLEADFQSYLDEEVARHSK